MGNQNARKHPKIGSPLKLKVGQKVWLNVPVNGVITEVKEKFGYEIEVSDVNSKYAYFNDEEVQPI